MTSRLGVTRSVTCTALVALVALLVGCSGNGSGTGFGDLEQNDETPTGDACEPLPPMEEKVVLGYLPSWVNFPELVASLDMNTMTHLTLAFTNPTGPNGETELEHVSEDEIHALVSLAHENGVKVMASVGGINHSELIRERLEADLVDAYVEDLAEYLDKFDLDGVDVDIEGSAVDATYGPFVRKLTQRLRPEGRLVTAAVASWFQEAITNEALVCFDFINIMAYDAAGGWTGPEEHASQEWARATVQYWDKSRGVDPTRVVLGLPFYGYCWGTGCPGDSGGIQVSIAWIAEHYPDQLTGDWIYDEPNDITINFNGTATIEEKTRFSQDYGGVMIWEMSQDTSDAVLMSALRAGLSP